MKIGLFTFEDGPFWGGGEIVAECISEGLREIGQDVIIGIGTDIEALIPADFIFLINIHCISKENHLRIQHWGKRIGIIPFHENFSDYASSCFGFANFVSLCLCAQGESALFRIEQLLENPNIVELFSSRIPFSPAHFEDNRCLLDKAEICIATSHTEAAWMLRNHPQCRAKTVYLHPRIPDSCSKENDDAFLAWTGLKKGEYVLQVGRMEMRKNQIGSVLSMADLDMPLVFIATHSYQTYTEFLLKAIQRYRRAPTILISQNLDERQEGNLRIIQMPGKHKLDLPLLISAYRNAGLYLHPAFCELPGLVMLEAAKLGVPQVASSWTTLKDYFTDPITNEYTLDDRIVYCPPHHILEMADKIKQQFGRKINKDFIHPMLQRTKADVARDFLSALSLDN